MPTNDERREIAARLREVAPTYESRHNPDWSSSLCSIAGSPSEIFARLADLIEPEERTCEKLNADSNDILPRCSECGSLMGHYVNYCQMCGAKVVG